MDLNGAGEKRFLDLNELEEIRNNAYLNTKIAKERSNKWHDQMITRKNFKEGDQVLLYDSKLHLFPGKLKSRWTGPFTVQQAYPNGSVDLRDPNDDRLFKVNGQRVKQYVVQQVIKEKKSPDGPSLNPTFCIFKGGYFLVPAATILIALSHKFSFVYKMVIMVRV